MARALFVGRASDEDVLQRDDVGFEPQNLGDMTDATASVDEAGDLHQQVERA